MSYPQLGATAIPYTGKSTNPYGITTGAGSFTSPVKSPKPIVPRLPLVPSIAPGSPLLPPVLKAGGLPVTSFVPVTPVLKAGGLPVTSLAPAPPTPWTLTPQQGTSSPGVSVSRLAPAAGDSDSTDADSDAGSDAGPFDWKSSPLPLLALAALGLFFMMRKK